MTASTKDDKTQQALSEKAQAGEDGEAGEEKAQQTVVVLKDHQPIKDAVHAMIDNGISCVLIEDRYAKICGIVTERDIVRRLTLARKTDKLKAMVRAIMTFPVLCIPPTGIKQSLRPLLFHQRLRHFPIATTNEPKTEEVLGLITVTDLARLYIGPEEKVAQKVDVALITSGGGYQAQLRQIFTELEHEVIATEQWRKLKGYKGAMVVDLDDPIVQDKTLLNKVLAHKEQVIFLTQKAERYAPIRTRLKNPKHHVLLKPVDFTVLGLILADATPKSDAEEPLDHLPVAG